MKIFLIIMLAVGFFVPVFANETEALDKVDIVKLVKFKENLSWFDKEIARKSKSLRIELSPEVRQKLEIEINELTEKQIEMRAHFLEVLSGISLRYKEEITSHESKDFLKEFQDLLAPIITGLRRISERPRKIEKLRFEITNFIDLMETRKAALQKLNHLLTLNEYNALWDEIGLSKRLIENEINQLSFDVDTRIKTLNKILGEKKSFWDESKTILGTFFKNRGKHLLISLLAFVAIFWLQFVIKKKVFRFTLFNNKLKILRKPLNALYLIISFVIAFLGSLIILYVLNDWVLVTIFIFLVAGLLWSFKQFVPKLLEEARLIFNLGPVRENERIIWEGIPWKVVNLGFYSKIENEALESGSLLISAAELLKNHSRPCAQGEPWFPTQKGDWVLVDGAYGKVILQTPEQVIVEKSGGELKYFHTADFISLKPENLSQGYWIKKVFGLDYGIQEIINTEILEKFKTEFNHVFKKQMNFANDILDLIVDFHDCGQSSLNIAVIIKISGTLADKKYFLERKMENTFLDLCNKYKYTIPFTQINVHLPGQV